MQPEARASVRCLLVDHERRVLLQEIFDPEDGKRFWITPGGAVDPGETETEGLRRELREEAGITDIDLGPVVWTRQHVFPFDGKWYHQTERFYLAQYRPQVHLPPDPTAPDFGLILGHRWWTIDELRRTEHEVAPERLADGLERIWAEGPPTEPYDIGI